VNNKKLLTRTQDREVAQRYRRGARIVDLAADFGVSVYAIRSALGREKVERVGKRAAQFEAVEYPIELLRPERTFCGQCERLVAAVDAARCGSVFCKAVEQERRVG
jgi:hypothetical protein